MTKENTLIIGATSSFGQAIAKNLLNQGHNLLLTYLNQSGAADLLELSDKAHSQGQVVNLAQLDVLKMEGLESLARTSPLALHNLVYSVSLPISFKTLEKHTWHDFDQHFQVQVRGLWQVILALSQSAQPLKNVVVIGSSCLFEIPPARLTDYTVAKYALLGLVKCLAVELASKKIRVNMISPGLTGKGVSAIYPEAFIEMSKVASPQKRLVNEEEVAEKVSFLLSAKAAHFTGQNFSVETL